LGKVSLAFDHIKDNKEIQELSVVLYTDSFFYGLWGSDNRLLKSGYHPMESFSSLVQLWHYYYDISETKVLSAIKPYVHVSNTDFQEKYFDVYFRGLYNLERLAAHNATSDKFDGFDITTLHYLDQKSISLLLKYDFEYEAAHISTAMANYGSQNNIDLVCSIANNILHVCLKNVDGFQLYNQFDCYYDQDYLYYLSLICERFALDRETVSVNMSGELDPGSSLYKLLNSFFGNINFLSSGITFTETKKEHEANYYDLYFCKACV